VRILGIDPGYSIIGWAVIESNLKIVSFGTVQPPSYLSLNDKLVAIHDEIKELIQRYTPDCAAIEKIYFSRNTKTAMDVAKCIGVISLTIKMANIEIQEYNPTQIKHTITGYGKADKNQIQKMITKIYNINTIPKPDDAADAIAIATCHSLNMNL
jgi:crossover junction endodeoxyribonuclease RuvC